MITGDAWEPDDPDTSWPEHWTMDPLNGINERTETLGPCPVVPDRVMVALGTSGRVWLVWHHSGASYGSCGIEHMI